MKGRPTAAVSALRRRRVEELTKAGGTQRSIAAELGVSQTAVSKIQRSWARLSLQGIADAAGVSIAIAQRVCIAAGLAGPDYHRMRHPE